MLAVGRAPGENPAQRLGGLKHHPSSWRQQPEDSTMHRALTALRALRALTALTALRAPGWHKHTAEQPGHSLGTTARAELGPCAPDIPGEQSSSCSCSLCTGRERGFLIAQQKLLCWDAVLGACGAPVPNTCIHSDTSAKESEFVICVSVVRHQNPNQ